MHAKYYVKSGLTNVLKNANKTKYMHLCFSILIANYFSKCSFREISIAMTVCSRITELKTSTPLQVSDFIKMLFLASQDLSKGNVG